MIMIDKPLITSRRVNTEGKRLCFLNEGITSIYSSEKPSSGVKRLGIKKVFQAQNQEKPEDTKYLRARESKIKFVLLSFLLLEKIWLQCLNYSFIGANYVL